MYEHTDGKQFSANSGFETVSERGDHASTSAGTFTLRRAHYFSKAGKPSLSAEQHQELTNPVKEVEPFKLSEGWKNELLD